MDSPWIQRKVTKWVSEMNNGKKLELEEFVHSEQYRHGNSGVIILHSGEKLYWSYGGRESSKDL